MKRRLPVVVILVSLAVLTCWTLRGVERPPMRTFRVDAGGHSLEMCVSGDSGPVVVLESGLPGGMGWPQVQAVAGRFARVVSYSRAGLGDSEPGAQPRDARCIAGELRTALRNANLPPPYVMVGQSMGGPYVRVFAAMFPDDVAGLVIIDPARADGAVTFDEAHAWFAEHLPELWPRVETLSKRVPEGGDFMMASSVMGFEKSIAGLDAERRETLRREWWALVDSSPERLNPQLSPGARDEFKAAWQSFEQAKAATPLPKVPTVLIVAGRFDEILQLTASLTPHLRDFHRTAREQKLADHRRWVRETPGATMIVAERSGHNVQTEDPRLVVDAIRDVIARSPSLR